MSTGNANASYSWDDIRKHDKESDAWVVLKGEVFDVSKFLKEHPGGSSIVLPHLGTDIEEVDFSPFRSIFRPVSKNNCADIS